MDGCLRPTPIDNLFVLAGITPNELRRKRATLSLARSAMDPENLLHDRLLFTSATAHYTTARTQIEAPFVPALLELLKDLDKANATEAFWADHK